MSIIQPGKYVYRTHNIDLTNGLVDYRIPVDADKLFYNVGTIPIQVKLNTTSNDAIILKPKMSIEAELSDFFISAAPVMETIQIISSKPSSISIGGDEIRVINDTGYFDAWNANAFVGWKEMPLTIAANQWSYVQLWNPVGSGVWAIVDEIDFWCTIAATQTVYVGRHNAPILFPTAGHNKKFDQPDSICEVRGETHIPFGTLYKIFVHNFAVKIGSKEEMRITYIIPPGWGLHTGCQWGAAGNWWCVNYEWREFPFIP